MCDPILNRSHIQESDAFTKKTVQEYLDNPEGFTKFPSRHYSQTQIGFRPEEIRKRVQELGIPITNTNVTVFGGYTGQFALSLREIGMSVVFTDISEEWVSEAKAKGMDAYRYSVQEIPKDLLLRTDLFATFECYPVMLSNAQWVFLRLLAAKVGLLFAESRRTFGQMLNESRSDSGGYSRLKLAFLPFAKVYHVSRQQQSPRKSELVFYYFQANELWRELMRTDWKTLKGLHDNIARDSTVSKDEVKNLASILNMDKRQVLSSVQRLFLLHRLWIGDFGRRYSKFNEFDAFSKTYLLDPDFIPFEALVLQPVRFEAYELLKLHFPERLSEVG